MKFDEMSQNSEIPLVSILLPNLNFAKYLHARFESIATQTFSNWEVIVVDGFSSDGSWEIIQEFAVKDARIKAFQESPKGVYAAWNSCLAKACGEFITIATSDDTMHPLFLETMVGLLKQYNECDVAMCGLEFIDAEGQPLPSGKNWESFPAPIFYNTLGNWMHRSHIRRAPLDGVLSFAIHNIYHSTTQILVRRVVYDTVGNYRCDLGIAGDFDWAAKVGMEFDLAYTPQKLATWRIHDEQLSREKIAYTAKSMETKLAIVESVLSWVELRRHKLAARLRAFPISLPFHFQETVYKMRENHGVWDRLLLMSTIVRTKFKLISIVLPIALRVRGDKEALRAGLAHWLLKMSGLRVDDLIKEIS